MSKARRLWKNLAVLTIVFAVIAGAGFLYLRAAATAAASDTDVTAADDTAADGTEADKGEAEDGEDETRIPVSVATVGLGSVSSYITATANLVAENDVVVLAEAEGRLADLTVEEGDTVERGEILAVLQRDDEQIAYDKAEVKAANAEMAFERAVRLAKQGLIPDEEMEKATLDHRVAQQEVAEARVQLDKTEIRAPFRGRITVRNVTVGQHIRVNDPLFTVTDFDPLIARVYLPEKDIVGLSADRDVRITLQADEDVSFAGRIRQISPVVDVATGTVKLTVEAVHPPAEVRPGGFVEIHIVRETRKGVLLLPREAVVRELQRAHAFIADGDKALKREITLGLEEGGRVEVLSGLTAGEAVIIAGQGGLKDGAAIKVVADPTAVADARPAASDHSQG